MVSLWQVRQGNTCTQLLHIPDISHLANIPTIILHVVTKTNADATMKGYEKQSMVGTSVDRVMRYRKTWKIKHNKKDKEE